MVNVKEMNIIYFRLYIAIVNLAHDETRLINIKPHTRFNKIVIQKEYHLFVDKNNRCNTIDIEREPSLHVYLCAIIHMCASKVRIRLGFDNRQKVYIS